MSLVYLKVCLLFLISTLGYVCALYNFRFETLQKLEGDTETLVEFNLRLLGRLRLMNGTIIFHTDIDDTFHWRIGIEQHRNGEWKPFDHMFNYTTCLFVDNFYRKLFQSSLEDSNMPRDKDACPFKKGEYYLRNVAMRPDNWMRYVKPGLNKCVVQIWKDNKMYGGFDAVAELTEIST